MAGCTGEDGDGYLLGPPVEQNPGAFARGGTGGQNIVHQKDAFSFHRCAKSEGALQVAAPLPGRKPLLGRGGARSNQKGRGDRNPFFPKPARDQESLIVGTLSNFFRVQGNRDDQVRGEGRKHSLDGFAKEQTQGEVEMNRILVLEPVHCITESPGVNAGRGDGGEGRRLTQAPLAQVVTPRLGGIGEGAAGAVGRGEGSDAGQATGAETAGFQAGSLCPAEGAGGGEDEIKEPGQFRPQIFP